MDIVKEAGLVGRIRKAVAAEEDDKRAAEAVSLLSAYSGDAQTLDSLMRASQTDNLLRAVAHLKLVNHVYSGGERAIGRSLARPWLTRQAYIFQTESGGTVTFGYQSTPKLFETFGTPEQREWYAPENVKRRGKERKATLEQRAKEFSTTLEDALIDPEKASRSPVDRQSLRAILALDAEVLFRLQTLDALRYEGIGTERVALLELQKGGQVNAWFEQHFATLEDSINLEDPIKDAFLKSKSDYLQLTPSDQKFLSAVLFTYFAQHAHIDVPEGLSSFVEDITMLREEGRQIDTTSVDHLLRRSQMTLLDAAAVMNVKVEDMRLLQYRTQRNRAFAAQYEQDLAQARSLFTSLVLENEMVREDLMKGSIPKRLSNSLYAAALDREDFIHIRDWLLESTLTAGTGHEARSMQRYQLMIESVVSSARRIANLKQVLDAGGIPLADGENIEVRDRYRWQNLNLLSTKEHRFVPVENFQREHGISLEVALKRWADLKAANMLFAEEIHSVSPQTIRDGLRMQVYDVSAVKGLAALLPDTMDASEAGKELAAARRVLSHPYFAPTHLWELGERSRHWANRKGQFEAPTLRKSGLKDIARLASLEVALPRAGVAEMNIARMRELHGKNLWNGELKRPHETRYHAPKTIFAEIDGNAYFSPEGLEAEVAARRPYIVFDADKRGLLRFMASSLSNTLREKAGLAALPLSNYVYARRFESGDFAHAQLLEQAKKEYDTLAALAPATKDEAFNQARLYDRFEIVVTGVGRRLNTTFREAAGRGWGQDRLDETTYRIEGMKGDLFEKIEALEKFAAKYRNVAYQIQKAPFFPIPF